MGADAGAAEGRGHLSQAEQDFLDLQKHPLAYRKWAAAARERWESEHPEHVARCRAKESFVKASKPAVKHHR
jgi:hypothetical protein